MTRLICMLSLNFYQIINAVKKSRTPLFITLMLLSLSACQSLSDSNDNKADFSHYYLWINSLSSSELKQEVTLQKSNKELGYAKADVQLIMLYSLPNSPIYNPYTAKALLNDYPLAPYIETTFNSTDLAFIVMLKDQLNQQLLLLEKLTNYKAVYQQSKKVNTAQQLKINQLNKQIIQLKKIEKTISKRGQ